MSKEEIKTLGAASGLEMSTAVNQTVKEVNTINTVIIEGGGGGGTGGSTNAADIIISAESDFYGGMDVEGALQEIGADLHGDGSDYTAFEVFAHDYDIPVGEHVMTIDDQTFANARFIPADNTHVMSFRTMTPKPEDCDIVVDWGDGTVETVANGDYLPMDDQHADTDFDTKNGEGNYTFRHTYAKNGKFIVKIYGKNYYSIKSGVGVGNSGLEDVIHNLICRAVDWDLPIASNYSNLSNMVRGAKALLYINVDRLKYRYYTNLSGFAQFCINLVKAVGFKRQFTTALMQNAFNSCFEMVECDAQLTLRSLYNSASTKMYFNCVKLAVDINSLFPDRPVAMQCAPAEFREVFCNCGSLTGTIKDYNAKVLWNNSEKLWCNTERAFTGCSDELRAQVPESWGGTMSDGDINHGVSTDLANHSVSMGFDNTPVLDGEFPPFQSFIVGDKNTYHSGDVIIGGNNSTQYGFCTVKGNHNKLYQFNTVVGDSNTSESVGVTIFGTNNQIGAKAQYSFVVGDMNIVNAKNTVVLGDGGQLDDEPQNSGAFALAGGSGTEKICSFVHRRFKNVENPLYKEGGTEPQYEAQRAFRTNYKGQLLPDVQTEEISGNTALIFDLNLFSRFKLTGSGTADVDFVNYEDGFIWELIVDTSKISLVLDAGIIGGDDVYTASAGMHLMKFMCIDNKIYCKIEF